MGLFPQKLRACGVGFRSAPFQPFRLIGNIYYVGASGISSFFITTPRTMRTRSEISLRTKHKAWVIGEVVKGKGEARVE